jgi:hypothetical protein
LAREVARVRPVRGEAVAGMSRRPGRPPLDDADTTVRMSFRLPTRKYDALCTRAKVARLTLSEFVRVHLAPPAGGRFVPRK